jgi:choline dehydrogenase-like flavoprotein
MLIDARSLADDSEFACDLCVVGAGPAGIAIVNRLRESGLSIVLIESGGFELDVETQKLSHGENRGHPYYPLDACRFRVFGGSSYHWGGWCRPLDVVDFERKEWSAGSGWPIDEESLRPYYSDTARLFELPNSHFDIPSLLDRLPAPFAFEDSNFESAVVQYSPRTKFGEAYRPQLLAAGNVTTLLRANVIGIELSSDSMRVELLRAASLNGHRITIRPRAVVLATGGLENARVLLSSQKDRPAGLGNESDLVGRYFMEHLHVPVGHLRASKAAGDWSLYRGSNFNNVRVRGLIVPTAAARNRHRLLATSISLEPAIHSVGKQQLIRPTALGYGAIRAYRYARAGWLGPLVKTLGRAVAFAATLPTRYRTLDMALAARSANEARDGYGPLFSLFVRAEQAPDPASRVTLSNRRDALGVPEIVLDWRVNQTDTSSVLQWLELLKQDVSARGLGEIILPPEGWQNQISGGPHHMGTTRMSRDPRHGVVDEHCRVHSVDNLYIAGSSVFATGGYANPTFTLVALALRLADTLSARLRKPILGAAQSAP